MKVYTSSVFRDVKTIMSAVILGSVVLSASLLYLSIQQSSGFAIVASVLLIDIALQVGVAVLLVRYLTGSFEAQEGVLHYDTEDEYFYNITACQGLLGYTFPVNSVEKVQFQDKNGRVYVLFDINEPSAKKGKRIDVEIRPQDRFELLEHITKLIDERKKAKEEEQRGFEVWE